MFLLQFPKVSGRKPSTSTAADRNSEGDGLSDEDSEDIGDITRITPIREEEPEATAAVEEPQRKAKSKGKGKSAGNGDSTDTLAETLLKRANKASEERKAMMQPKSTQEKVVNQFRSYLSTQLNQIKPELWFDFTMACQRLVHTYVTQSEQKPSASYEVYHQHQLPDQPQQPAQAYQQRSLSTPPGSVSYTALGPVTGYGQHLPQSPGCYKPSFAFPRIANPNMFSPILPVVPSSVTPPTSSEAGTAQNISQAMNLTGLLD